MRSTGLLAQGGEEGGLARLVSAVVHHDETVVIQCRPLIRSL